MDRLIQAGLTGGIASGKTTAASVLARLGARIVDTDELARRALDPATPAFEAAVRAFGRQILNADGAVDRVLWLPPGRWRNLWTGAITDAGPTGLDVTMRSAPGQPPVFLAADGSSTAGILDALQAEGIGVAAGSP